MKILILSDIHANLTALMEVVRFAYPYGIDKAILLGDHIDYGMRPNEVIRFLECMDRGTCIGADAGIEIAINIWGNHERAIFDCDLSQFSSDRGKKFSSYTACILSVGAKSYIASRMNADGIQSVTLGGKSVLAVHGSLDDVFWKSLTTESACDDYTRYDYVLSGHSHKPHYFERYFDNPESRLRGKKKTVFINPGSVGQPRNHKPEACYAVLDITSGSVHLNAVEYDVKAEQALYGDEVDEFYKLRLKDGI